MQPTGPVTLGDLIREDKLLWVYCRECCHERDVNPANVPLPADTPVPEVEKKMKCSKCGSRAVETKPELYPGGVGVGYVRSHLPNEAQPFAER